LVTLWLENDEKEGTSSMAKFGNAFFEGWYFKHQKGEDTISFIPGINIDSKGNRSAFIQVITNRNSYYME